MRATTEEKELMLLDAMEFLRNWNQENETVLNLKYVYRRAEKLAVDLNNMKMLDEVVEYTRFYQPSPDHHDPDTFSNQGNDIAELLDCDNRIIALDYKGYCLLLYDIDEWGNSSGEMYVIRSAAKVYEVLREKSCQDHTMNKDD